MIAATRILRFVARRGVATWPGIAGAAPQLLGLGDVIVPRTMPLAGLCPLLGANLARAASRRCGATPATPGHSQEGPRRYASSGLGRLCRTRIVRTRQRKRSQSRLRAGRAEAVRPGGRAKAKNAARSGRSPVAADRARAECASSAEPVNLVWTGCGAVMGGSSPLDGIDSAAHERSAELPVRHCCHARDLLPRPSNQSRASKP